MRQLFILVCMVGTMAYSHIKLPAIFGNNMVLQQKAVVPIWGTNHPGEEVVVHGSWDNKKVRVVAGQDGKWKLKIQTPAAGGPYELTVDGADPEDKTVLHNVLIGEVWVCSGQSNMEFSMNQTDHAAEDIAAAKYPNIRLFTVQKNMSPTPQADCVGSWQPCSPETVPGFSAVAYFFGKKLHQEMNVPIGLIHTSWGGTEAELWTSEAKLKTLPDFRNALAKTGDAQRKYESDMKQWQESIHHADAGWDKWNKPNADDIDWKAAKVPAQWEQTDLPNFDGIAWYRATFAAPESWAGKAVTLSLGPIDDEDITWVNGRQVGANNNFQTVRQYVIPAGVVKAGLNSVAVRVTDTGGAGGIYGLPEQIYAEMDSRRVALTDWKIKVGADKKDLPPLPQVSVRPNSLLYNGMIAPILPYGIRGAIWYQGESNVGRAYQYRTLFPAMIENWREDWGEGAFPFYFVQIAPFAYGANDMSAELREAQLLTLKLANTGMAVISDVTGNVQDIHPKDKRDVGARLALWALAQTYGKKGFEYSGPLYKSYKVDGNRIIVTFDHAVGLMAKGGAPTGFTIAGSDKKFVPAQAEIHGDTVIVTSPNVPNAAAVRFSWSDAGVHNLCNAAGLPASPFRTDTWPGLTDGVKW